MISAGEFRKGITFQVNSRPCVVIDFQHVKPGKGAAFVRTKYKDLITGAIREEAFNPSEKFPRASILTKTMQYLYSDGELYYFMDNDTYEQIPVQKELMEEAVLYIKENDNATLKFYEGSCFIVEPPNFVELKVVESEPSVKGDTASNVTKKVIVETGAEINVPLFVDEGDTIKIDTRTGEYLSRV
ncbi:MAG: elongation factor P [delta proteobacterium ML8_F1]|nr:MAG: elongation factor P [delta proteobacterium ML8_F1]